MLFGGGTGNNTTTTQLTDQEHLQLTVTQLSALTPPQQLCWQEEEE
jgi:hypothetical protein